MTKNIWSKNVDLHAISFILTVTVEVVFDLFEDMTSLVEQISLEGHDLVLMIIWDGNGLLLASWSHIAAGISEVADEFTSGMSKFISRK